MSSGKTEHYQLHLWQPEDAFVRTEFNDNTRKVDEALAEKCDTGAFQLHKQTIEAAVASKADNAEFQALRQSVNAAVPGKCEALVGAYRGVWSSAETSQHIVLGRQPKAVIVWGNSSSHSQNLYGPCYGMGVTGCSGAGVTITGDGFIVRSAYDNGGTLYPSLNLDGFSYMYLAIF